MEKKVFFAPFLNSKNGVSVFSNFFLNGIITEFEIITTEYNSFLCKENDLFKKISIFDLINLIYKSNIIYISCWHNFHSLFVIIISIFLRKKLVFISHGVSLIGYYFSFKEFIRTLVGIFYFLLIFLLAFFFEKVIIVSPQNIIDKKRFLDIYIYNFLKIPYSFYSFKNYKKYLIETSLSSEKSNCLFFDNKELPKFISLIGYYSHIKNQLLFLNIAKNFPNHKFVILGKKQGIYYNTCLDFIKVNNLYNILLIDECDCDVVTLLQNTICLLSCSISESFGLVMLEASLLNIPIISTNTGISFDVNAKIANNLDEFISLLSGVLEK